MLTRRITTGLPEDHDLNHAARRKPTARSCQQEAAVADMAADKQKVPAVPRRLPIPSDDRMGRPAADDGERQAEHAEGMRTIDQAGSPESAYRQPLQDKPESSLTRPVPRWLIALVIAGALLTAAGAVMALLPSADHLNAAGQHYADYFVTRNFALSLALLVTLARRAWRVLPALMTLTALIQSFDAVTALATGQFGLVPIDLVFAGLFLMGAARLSGHVWPVRKKAL